ncbi:hypothetical protein TNCV_9221 [Trichonephila clavipes]|nr:hypothetical protein TNCV_9221 [Trichonephila clavipes]
MTLGTEVHEQMFRSGGQFDVKPPVFSSQASLVLICHPTEGMKGCSRAFGDGPRNFELWSGDKDDTSPNFLTTPTGRCLSTDR